MSITYPYPSNVNASSFVTVKLRGKEMYGIWKTQMLCLLKSHDMLDFIHESIPAAENKLWERSDALVQGWILGSLSEHEAMNFFKRSNSKDLVFTAKNIWDQLKTMYGEEKDERASGQHMNTKVNSTDVKDEVAKAKERAKELRKMYVVANSGRWKCMKYLSETARHVEITKGIGANGNTALHVAAASDTRTDEADFLKNMLDMLPNDIHLSNVRNSDGSTLLHIAASVGNTHSAKFLVEKWPELLFVRDNEGCTPLDIVLSNPNSKKEVCHYLLDKTTQDLEQPDVVHLRIEESVVYAICSKDFELAKTLLERCNVLRSDAVLMAIAQNWHPHIKFYESIIYELWKTEVVDFATRGSLDFAIIGYQHLDILTNIKLFSRVAIIWYLKCVIRIWMKTPVWGNVQKRVIQHHQAKILLDEVCAFIKLSNSNQLDSCFKFYSKPITEAIRQDACGVVEQIVSWFPNAINCVDEDGHNICQQAWKNRALDILVLIANRNMAKHIDLSQKIKNDPNGNNFLHHAARLAPPSVLNRIQGSTFKLQRELNWFEVVQKFVPLGMHEKNMDGETPEMVFAREHKELVIESAEWIKSTANSYIVTAVLIITIVFAAAITVPGGNNDNDPNSKKLEYGSLVSSSNSKELKYGSPKYVKDPVFILFIISIALSMFTATSSLLFFLGIMTSRFEKEDFKNKLPITLMIGLGTLILSATFMIISFGATLFLMFGYEYPWSISLIGILVVLPISVFIIYQIDLLYNLLASSLQFQMAIIYNRLKLLGRIFV